MSVFIIAEAGVNHNGSLKLAKQLIDAASSAGADAVKFQTFTAETLVSKSARVMKDFAVEHGIAIDQSGKVIIATSADDLPTIDKLLKNAKDNNIKAIKLNAAEVKEIEPYANPYESGIYSPDTAVIDSQF